jgi:anthranilate synthase/aminodeoxychorismate synthase-like glutamine amidotransferase
VKPRVLLVDNYDSFVHNLARYVRELGAEATVHRNDSLSVADARSLAPSHIVVSPGPCTPREAGVSNALIAALGPSIPVLGVCLGHQCLAAALGGRVVRAAKPRHGKTSPIVHDGRGLFEGLPSPFLATRYHSLIVEEAGLPECLEVMARTPEGEIMAIRHRAWPAWGVQFHPESVLTEHGHDLIRNFLGLDAEAA